LDTIEIHLNGTISVRIWVLKEEEAHTFPTLTCTLEEARIQNK